MRGTLFLIPLLWCGICFAQEGGTEPLKRIEVGKNSYGNQLLTRLVYSVQGSDTTYTLTFRDTDQREIVSYESFSFEGNTLESFYEGLKSAIDAPAETESNIMLGRTRLVVLTQKVSKNKYLQVRAPKGAFMLGSVKDIDKLFGKK